MVEIVKLGVQVESQDLDKATKRFQEATDAADGTEEAFEDVGEAAEDSGKKVSKAGDGLAKFVKQVIAFLAVERMISNLIDVNREFDNLEASLVTITGSTEKANIAFGALKNLANSEGFNLQELTSGFIKLKARGVQPTEETLISFGNTAAAMGKSLDQFIEAVADATTSEFERLKEFGIKAKVSGDQVAFTFAGQTTVVRNSAQAIQGYLEELGATEFAGALARQADTIGGSVVSMQGAFAAFARQVGESGFNEALVRFVNFLTNTTKGSMSLAETLGKGLAVALDAVTTALEFVVRHSEAFLIVGGAIIGLQLAKWALAAAAAFRTLFLVIAKHPFLILVTAVALVIDYFGGLEVVSKKLEATFIVMVGSFVKGANTLGSVGRAIYEAFKTPFTRIGEIFDAFKDDLKEFIADPFGGNAGFDKLESELSKGFGDAFKGAYEKVRKEGQEFNRQIDAEIDDRLVRIGDQIREIESNSNDADGAFKETAKTLKDILDVQTDITEEQGKQLENEKKANEERKKREEEARKEQDRIDKEVEDRVKKTGEILEGGIAGVFKGGSFKDAMRDMLDDWNGQMADWASEEIFDILDNNLDLSGLFDDMFRGNSMSTGGNGGFLDGIVGSVTDFLGFGGSSGGGVSSGGGGDFLGSAASIFSDFGSFFGFANGGVFDSPVGLNLGGGNRGVMAEAGPEAIMPLKKVNGKLGVATEGGGAGSQYNVNMTVVTSDADSFRRNEAQMMADLNSSFKRLGARNG